MTLELASDGPSVVLVRHGETEWSRARKHTSFTDVGLTDAGAREAQRAGRLLSGLRFGTVLSSPRRRSRETARAAGFPSPAVVDELVEWDYGVVEGRTTADISAEVGHPWSIWTAAAPDPVPAESVEDVGRRADAVIARLRAATAGDTDALVFSHGHFLRILAARWLDLPPAEGRRLALSPGGVSELGFEHADPVIARWNMPV